MIDVNWDLAPEGAVELKYSKSDCSASWFNRKGEHWFEDVWMNVTFPEDWQTISTRPTQTKTVADAVEWSVKKFNHQGWHYADYDCITYGSDGLLYADSAKIKDGRELICTREQFEAYVKEKDSEKWTHTVNFGFSEQAQCKIISESGDFVWAQVDGAGCPATYKKSELKPIKPTMTKEQYEFLRKFSEDSNSLRVTAEVESYLAKHDII